MNVFHYTVSEDLSYVLIAYDAEPVSETMFTLDEKVLYFIINDLKSSINIFDIDSRER